MAELGLLNYEDDHKKLRHFMDYTVPLESIYENRRKTNNADSKGSSSRNSDL
mgnify:CR=1 FL=1